MFYSVQPLPCLLLPMLSAQDFCQVDHDHSSFDDDDYNDDHHVDDDDHDGVVDDHSDDHDDLPPAASYTCVYNLVGCPAGIVPVTRRTSSPSSLLLSICWALFIGEPSPSLYRTCDYHAQGDFGRPGGPLLLPGELWLSPSSGARCNFWSRRMPNWCAGISKIKIHKYAMMLTILTCCSKCHKQ